LPGFWQSYENRSFFQQTQPSFEKKGAAASLIYVIS
jgi:hypothetical protein